MSLTITNSVNTLPWNENSANRWGKRALSRIKKIVIHQALGTKTAIDTNAYCISKENHTKPGVGLPHIAYHFFIDMPNGEIHQCNAYDNLTWHVKGHNTISLGVCLGGFFDYGSTKGRDHKPTLQQLTSLDFLINYLMDKFSINIENVFAHGELQTKPSCPGATILEFLNTKRKK